MWSVAFSESSQSSIGEMQHVTQSATEKMAEILCQSPDLQTLYKEATERLPKDAFLKHHDDMLKSFFELLRSEITSERQLKTIRILRHRSHRQQVTNLVYKMTGPKLSTETLQARENFLNQRENRDETLARYLHSGVNPKEVAAPSRPTQQSGTDSSDDEDDDEISLEELTSMVKFLMNGAHSNVLRAYLNSLARPETAIAEILRTGSLGILQNVLSKQFSTVAVGDFEWIRGLHSAGYTKSEIAQLLMEETTDSPFIYFQPRISDATIDSSDACDPRFHVAGCIHARDDDMAAGMDHSLESKVPPTPQEIRPTNTSSASDNEALADTLFRSFAV
jgi:hypothetical protein